MYSAGSVWASPSQTGKSAVAGGVSLDVGHARLKANLCEVGQSLIGICFQRKVHVSVLPGKPRRRHSHDQIAFMIQSDRLSHGGGAGVKMPLPEFVAEFGHWLRVLPVDGVR